MNKTFIIAECATTWHIGKSAKRHLAYMIKCIHIAKQSGADCCKFQYCSAPGEMAKRRHIDNVGAYHRLAWHAKWLQILAAECESAGIEFMCTVYLPQDVAMIAPFVNRFKLASLELNDEAMWRAFEHKAQEVIASTGASTIDDWLGVGDWCSPADKFLMCTASYPAPLGSLNLNALKADSDISFHGLSDHSGDILTGALAVACGANIIEVHFRLDETRKDNPDFAHSHNPASLKQYVANIRKAELMLGDGIKKIEECERSLVKHRVTV